MAHALHLDKNRSEFLVKAFLLILSQVTGTEQPSGACGSRAPRALRSVRSAGPGAARHGVAGLGDRRWTTLEAPEQLIPPAREFCARTSQPACRAHDARARAPPPPGAAACAGLSGARPGSGRAPGGSGQTDAAAPHRGDLPGAQEVPLGGIQATAGPGPAGRCSGPQRGLGLWAGPRGAASGNCPPGSKDEGQVFKAPYRSSLLQSKVQQTLSQALPQYQRLHRPGILQEVCPAPDPAGCESGVHGRVSCERPQRKPCEVPWRPTGTQNRPPSRTRPRKIYFCKLPQFLAFRRLLAPSADTPSVPPST